MSPPSLLAFRPVSAVHRLPPRSQACPLSLRDLLRAQGGVRRPLPIVGAPRPALARAALLAAQQAGAAIGLGLPGGGTPEPWFDAVTGAADELAPRLPIFLSGEVAVEAGEGGAERAARRAWRLVEAGFTHLAVDVSRVAVAERARAAAQVAGLAVEREIAVELLLPGDGEPAGPEEAAAFQEELEGWGLRPDALGLRMAAPDGADGLRDQARRLAVLSAALGRTALVRHGPVTPVLLQVLRAAGVAAAEDGGRVRAAALATLPEEARRAWEAPAERGAGEPALEPAAAARLEALAFAEALAVIEAMGAGGSAAALAAGITAPGPR